MEATIGYAIGSGLIMFVFFLIYLGLLALIPPLKQRFPLRNVLAWLLGSLSSAYLSLKGGAESVDALVLAALFCGVLVALRYWLVTRKHRKAAAVAASSEV